MSGRMIPVLLFMLSAMAFSQQEHLGFVSTSSLNITTTNYYFAKPNEMTIVVTVIGHVERPGRYEISKSIDLINLIGLAGGANAEGTLSDVSVTRLVEHGGLLARSESHYDLEALTKVTASDLLVCPADIISVGRSTWATVRDIVIVTASAAVITTAVTQVIIVSRK